MKYKAIIFDLDGTLSDSLEDIADSLNPILRKYNLPIHDNNSYKQLVGNGLKKLVHDALPAEYRNSQLHLDCVKEFFENYESGCLIKTKPYKGVLDLLDELDLKGIKYAILSNKAEEILLEMVKTLFPGRKFAAVVGVKDEETKKPNPKSALDISKRLELKPNEIIFVGDGAVDMQTAKNAGIFAVGALWGFKTQEELVQGGADCLIEYPSDLIQLLS